jgi:hypothetical protein
MNCPSAGQMAWFGIWAASDEAATFLDQFLA